MVKCFNIPEIVAVAILVCDGQYGSGDERKRKLEKAGYNYKEVQSCVNKIYAIYKEYWKNA